MHWIYLQICRYLPVFLALFLFTFRVRSTMGQPRMPVTCYDCVRQQTLSAVGCQAGQNRHW